ncbi:MAG: hypothetical protein DRP75_04180, partial [Candidatus Omnitrophota bacterium]
LRGELAGIRYRILKRMGVEQPTALRIPTQEEIELALKRGDISLAQALKQSPELFEVRRQMEIEAAKRIGKKPYEGVVPGTSEWMRVWREHPELQKEMIEYAKTIKKPSIPPQKLPEKGKITPTEVKKPEITKEPIKAKEEPIPEELEPLAEEARKYKSEEEFVKDFVKDSYIKQPVYHGTNAQFKFFDFKKLTDKKGLKLGLGMGKGTLSFATSKGEASKYGKRIIEARLKIKKPFIIEGPEWADLNNERWRRVTEGWKDTITDIYWGRYKTYAGRVNSFIRQLKKEGYDAIILGHTKFDKNLEITVFYPHQVLTKDFYNQAIKGAKEAKPKETPEKPPTVQKLMAKKYEVEMAKEPETEKKINKTQIIHWVEKAFGVPIRGKVTVRMRKEAGQYKTKEELIRLRTWGELEPLTHELAHHIDKQMKQSLGKHWRTQKIPLGKRREIIRELGNLDYDQKQRRTSEGFAEFMRYFLTTDKASQKAPKFYKFFTETFLKEHPDLEKKILKLKEMLTIWQKQGAENRILAQIDWKGEHTKIGGVADKLQRAKDWILKNFHDEFYLIKKIEDQMGLKVGKNLRPTQSPFTMATYMKAKAGVIARTFVMEKAVDEYGNIVGKGLVEILKPIPNKKIKSFIVYGAAKRALNLAKRGIESGIDIEDAKYIVDKYKNDVWDKALEELTEWSGHLVNWITRAGGLTEKENQLIRDLNPVYLPFKRAFIDKIAVVKGAGGYVNRGEAIKRMKGSGRPILNPLEAMIAQTTELIAKAHKIRLAKLFADLAKRERVGGFITRIPPPVEARKINLKEVLKTLGYDLADVDINQITTVFFQGWQYKGKDNVFSIVEDGERVFYEVHPDLYRALSGVDMVKLPAVVRVLFAPFARMLRLGATGLRVAFALARNPFRDAFTYAVFSKRKISIPVFDTLKGSYKEITAKTGDLIWRFKYMGGALSGMIGLDRAATMAIYDEVLLEKLGKMGKVLKVIKHPIDATRNLFSFFELAPRSAELEAMYEKYRKEHPDWTEEDCFVQAFNDAQDVTINFTKSGYLAKRINEIAAFFNVSIRGPEKFYRSFRENPARVIIRGILYITLPSILLYLKNRKKQWYKNLPPSYKYNNFFIESRDGKTIWRLPVPFELGIVFGSAPLAALDYLEKKDPDYLEGLAQLIKMQIPDPTPSLVKPIIDVKSNKDFLGRPIETEGMQYLYVTERKREYTTKLAASLSKELDRWGMKISPIQIDYLLNAYTGGWVRQLPIRPQRELADIPVIGELLLRTPEFPARQLNSYFSTYETLMQKKRTQIISREELKKLNKIKPFYTLWTRKYSPRLKRLRKKGDIEKLKEIYKEITKDLKKYGFE